MIIFRFFTRRWIISTILVAIGIAGLVRLGIWQLDRLDQRRNFNARVSAQIQQPPLDMTGLTIDQDLASMEYRKVTVIGEYDFDNQVILRNQSWSDQYGVHLITPLQISGTDRVVMVDRGWIPAADMDPTNWGKYDEPGEITVIGTLRRSQDKPDFGRISDPVVDPGKRLFAWNLINLEQMKSQMPYNLLPVYITLDTDESYLSPPFKSELKLDLTEGPHFGYAIQWFSFGFIFALVYYIYVRREEMRMASGRSNKFKDIQGRETNLLLEDHNPGSHRGGKQ